MSENFHVRKPHCLHNGHAPFVLLSVLMAMKSLQFVSTSILAVPGPVHA